MRDSLQKALDKVEMTYEQIKEIADSLIYDYTKDINSLLSSVENAEELSNDELRGLMLKLAMRAYSFGDVKEKSAIKAQCAEIVRKEAYATKFNSLEGAIAAKDSETTLAISEEILAETLYDLVANLFKIKLEEIRRLIDTLKTILMSRISEMKLSAGLSAGLE